MELALRKQKILAAVIERYIATGEPIGSKSLQSADGLEVSSATIRNELADLTAKGFLIQPHTSAGRVPTEYGYRYYVDNLMKRKEPDERTRRYIENKLMTANDAPEHIIRAAGELASELLSSIRTALDSVTSSGMVKSRLFRCDYAITTEMLNVFDRSLNEQLAGQRLSYVNRPFAQTFAASFGELGLLMPDMLTAVMDACREALGMNVYVSGSTKLLYQSDFSLATARGVLEFLGDTNARDNYLKSLPEGVSVYIGKENSPVLLRRSAVVAARYMIENQPAGAIAVIGSLRLDYSTAVPTLEYIAKVVGELIGELISTKQ